jgi:hypothetical protein
VRAIVAPEGTSMSFASTAGAAADHVVAAGIGFAVPAGLALVDGGYYPSSWGWTAFGAAWITLLALLVRGGTLGRLEVASVALLAAYVGWALVSATWAVSVPRAFLEAERALVYVALLLMCLVVVRAHRVEALLAGIVAGSTAVSLYALGTRFFPDRSSTPLDDVSGHALWAPVGYANALALLAVLAAVLALGFAARLASVRASAAAAAATVPLVATLYLTFGRGAWLALSAGLVVAVAVDPERIRLVTSALALAPWPALAIGTISRDARLTRQLGTQAEQAAAGHRFALLLLALTAAAGATSAGLVVLSRRMRHPTYTGRAYAALAAAAVAVACAGAVAAAGGSPARLVDDTRRAFNAPTPVFEGDPSGSTATLTLAGTGRAEFWRTAWDGWQRNPVLGVGAGGYERLWERERTTPRKVRDAHSLYLETLAELGPLGLALLVAALALPVVAAVRARRRPLAGVAVGAYVAYLVHAGVDWDWEMPVVTGTALLIAASLLLADRRPQTPPLAAGRRLATVVAAGALTLLALVPAVGEGAAAAAAAAGDDGKTAKAAAEARRATRWLPWAAEPWWHAGQAQVDFGDRGQGLASLRRAAAADPSDWRYWAALAEAAGGEEARAALRRARELSPLEPELDDLGSDRP